VVEHVRQRTGAQLSDALPNPVRCPQGREAARNDALDAVYPHDDFSDPHRLPRRSSQQMTVFAGKTAYLFSQYAQLERPYLSQCGGESARAHEPAFLCRTQCWRRATVPA
jgi:hypothetical protein